MKGGRARARPDIAMHMPHDPETAPSRLAPASGVDGETALAHHLHQLWRFRWLLVAGPLLAGAVAYGIALTLTPRFQATATIMVTPSKAGEQATAPQPDVRSFRAFLANQSLAAEVVREFHLDAPPSRLTPQRFLASVLNIGDMRGTNLIGLEVTLSDPQLAARVANSMAERSVALSRSLEQREAVVARDFIKSQLDGARERLTQARDALSTYQRQAQVDLLEKKMDVLMSQQAELGQLAVDIQGERAYLRQAERDLAQQEPIRNVQRSVQLAPGTRPEVPPAQPRVGVLAHSNDRTTPGLGPRADGIGPATDRPGDQAEREPRPPVPVPPVDTTAPIPPRPQLRDALVDPYINPGYEMLHQDVMAVRSRLAQLEHKRDEILRSRAKGGQLAGLAEYYTRKTAENELKMQQELAEKIYLDVATRYEQARLQIAARSAQLQIVDAALAPDRKVFPREKLIASAAMVLAFSVLAAAIIALTAVTSRIQPAPAVRDTLS